MNLDQMPGFTDSLGSTLKNAAPPAAPSTNARTAPGVSFSGIGRPSTDFQAVRDGRRSNLLGFLVDLSVAHSIAAGTAIALPLVGNVFMSDPIFDLVGNSQAGVARVHFQDTTIGATAQGTYVTMLPSSIYKVTATQLLVENYAQAGKFLYIVYGVDVDLVAGSSQQVQATIINAVSANVTPAPAAHTDSAAVAAAASAQVLAANAARKYLAVQVASDQPAGIRIRTDGGAAADAAGSIEILPGDMYAPLVPPSGAITAIRKGGVNINFTITEA